MNYRPLLAAFFLSFGTFVTSLAQETAPASTPPVADLKILVDQIQAKLRAGKSSAADLAPELAAFDALLTKYATQRTDDVAQILFMQATLYGQVLNDAEKMSALLNRLKVDFPGTKPAAAADSALTALDRRAKAKEASASLVGKPAPSSTSNGPPSPASRRWPTSRGKSSSSIFGPRGAALASRRFRRSASSPPITKTSLWWSSVSPVSRVPFPVFSPSASTPRGIHRRKCLS